MDKKIKISKYEDMNKVLNFCFSDKFEDQLLIVIWTYIHAYPVILSLLTNFKISSVYIFPEFLEHREHRIVM